VTSGTLKDRIGECLADAAPSRDTSLLLAGLVSGTQHDMRAGARLQRKLSASTTWADIPNGRQASLMLSDVVSACGGGLAGRQERTQICKMIQAKLEDQARARVKAEIENRRTHLPADGHEEEDSDVDHLLDAAPVLPGEENRAVWQPPKRCDCGSPTPIPPPRSVLPAKFGGHYPTAAPSTGNRSLGGGVAPAYNKTSNLHLETPGAVTNSPRAKGLAGRSSSGSTLKSRPYSAPVRSPDRIK